METTNETTQPPKNNTTMANILQKRLKLKEKRKFFDSADYNMKGKTNEKTFVPNLSDGSDRK